MKRSALHIPTPAGMLLLAALLLWGGCDMVGDFLPPDEDSEAVEVTLEEFEIRMPRSLPAGPTTFRVTNAGDTEHNFEIEGQGIEKEFETNLQPGETKAMHVNLKSGRYEVYCPVANHRALGMELELTVHE